MDPTPVFHAATGRTGEDETLTAPRAAGSAPAAHRGMLQQALLEAQQSEVRGEKPCYQFSLIS